MVKKRVGYTQEFCDWYDTYPRNVGKFNASKSYDRIIKEWRVESDELLERTSEFREWCVLMQREKQYIAHPATRLNQHRREDDLSHV